MAKMSYNWINVDANNLNVQLSREGLSVTKLARRSWHHQLGALQPRSLSGQAPLVRKMFLPTRSSKIYRRSFLRQDLQ